MKRWLPGALLAVTVAGPLAGEAADCVPNEGCPEGQQPPQCCAPPPCQIYEYLKHMRAVRRMTSGERPWKALRDSKGDHAQAIAALRQSVADESGALRAPSGCELRQGKFTVPRFRLATGCVLQVETASGWSNVKDRLDPKQGPMSLHKNFDYCNELMEAEFMQWNLMAALCPGAVPKNVGWWAQQASSGAQEQIDVIMGHLQTYWGKCSTAMKEDTWKKLDEAGVDTEDRSEYRDAVVAALRQASSSKAKPSPSRKPRGGTR
jgi:hypothetical protein